MGVRIRVDNMLDLLSRIAKSRKGLMWPCSGYGKSSTCGLRGDDTSCRGSGDSSAMLLFEDVASLFQAQ